MKKRIFLIVFTLIYLSFLLISCSNKGSENAINFDGKSFYEKPQIIRKIKMDGYTTFEEFGYSMPLFYKNIMILLVDNISRNNSELQAIDINTNKIIWKNNNFYFYGHFYGHYYLYDNKLYVPIGRTIESLCDIVWCINPEDGKIIWETEIKETVLYDMVFYKNNIIISADNGKIYFLDKDNGKVIKEREFIFKNRENLSEMWEESPGYYIMTMALSKDILVLNSAAYGYIGYDIAKDKILWIYTVENTLFTHYISPAVDEDSAYLCTKNFYVCVDLISGKEKWKIEMDRKYSYSPCVVDEEKVYLESCGGITAFNKKTAEKIWECNLNLSKKYSFDSGHYHMYKYGNIIYYPLDYFYAIDAASGKILWEDKFDCKYFSKKNYKDVILSMIQYIVGIGIYNRKMYLVSINNVGERFAWLYILGYKEKNEK